MSKESMKHFGLYSDSTMKSMTKDKLIKYVHIIYDNWESCDETSERIVETNMKLLKENELLKREVKTLDEEGVMKCELNEKLSKALDKACEELNKLCKQTKCKNCHFVKEQEDCFNDCPVSGNQDKSIWREWCLEDNEVEE